MRRGIRKAAPCRLRPPEAALDERSLEQLDHDLLEVLGRDCATAAERAGAYLACVSGCDQCCHGPFPITRLDVRRLQQGLVELATREARRADRILLRATRSVEALAEGFPGEPVTGRLGQDPDVLDRFFERHSGLACPALDPRDGSCDLYEWRPVSCRTYGPPLRFGEEKAPHCRLCFAGAGAETVESCRMEPDRDGLEQSLLQRMGVSPGDEWETLIAFAIARDSG